jgi:hypothetical protein
MNSCGRRRPWATAATRRHCKQVCLRGRSALSLASNKKGVGTKLLCINDGRTEASASRVDSRRRLTRDVSSLRLLGVCIPNALHSIHINFSTVVYTVSLDTAGTHPSVFTKLRADATSTMVRIVSSGTKQGNLRPVCSRGRASRFGTSTMGQKLRIKHVFCLEDMGAQIPQLRPTNDSKV